MQFKQYKTTKNDDNSINIHDVEIFKLGKHKGFDFNADWMKKAIENFENEKSGDYLPPVIIGHNDGKEEKPVRGFLDNLKVTNDIVIADLTKVPEETFNALQKREFPNRSVEVNSEKAVFTGLALLGGTRPYHKLPIMEFHNDEAHEVIEFEDGDLKSAITREDKLSGLRNIWWKMWDFVDKIIYSNELTEAEKDAQIRDILGQGKELLEPEINNFKRGGKTMQLTEEQKTAARDLTIQEFKEKYGKTPDELAAENQQFRENQKKAQKEAFKNKVAAFGEKLKMELHVAPKYANNIVKYLESQEAATGAVITFTEDDKELQKAPLDFLQDVISSVFQEAAKGLEGQLFVPVGEMEHVEFVAGNINNNTSAKLDKLATERAKKFMESGQYKSNFEAYEAALYEILDEQDIKNAK